MSDNSQQLKTEVVVAQIHDIQLAQLYMLNRVYDLLIGLLRESNSAAADKIFELHKDLQTLTPPLVPNNE